MRDIIFFLKYFLKSLLAFSFIIFQESHPYKIFHYKISILIDIQSFHHFINLILKIIE